MAFNLIDLAKDYLTPDAISKMAGLVGESPAATQKALGAIGPSLAGIACNQASTPGGATKLMNFVTTGLPQFADDVGDPPADVRSEFEAHDCAEHVVDLRG
jgi:cytochrome c551/c552